MRKSATFFSLAAGIVLIGTGIAIAQSAAVPSGPATAGPAAADPAAAGQVIAFDRSKGNCLACHVIAGGTLMGNVGPALQNMKQLMPDPKQLYAVIYDEQARNPQTVMPPFGRNGILTPDEIKDVVAYLYTK